MFFQRRKELARPLTAGEVLMASAVFGDAIDYSLVKIFRCRYLPFGLQPKHCAMTPNGAIYFDKSCCLLDFSAGSEHARHWFMHEMTHVWQYQLGYPVWWRGAIRIGLRYRYTLEAGKTLADFNMEAQGDVLADYFALKHLGAVGAMRQRQYGGRLDLYETVLSGFLRQPASYTNLPHGPFRRLRRR